MHYVLFQIVFNVIFFTEKISDNPVKIKLLFETAARPLSGDGYYLQNKENVCVVCGACDSYHRKNIIPREYRKLVVYLNMSWLPVLIDFLFSSVNSKCYFISNLKL